MLLLSQFLRSCLFYETVSSALSVQNHTPDQPALHCIFAAPLPLRVARHSTMTMIQFDLVEKRIVLYCILFLTQFSIVHNCMIRRFTWIRAKNIFTFGFFRNRLISRKVGVEPFHQCDYVYARAKAIRSNRRKKFFSLVRF